jgi:hypothetical protein
MAMLWAFAWLPIGVLVGLTFGWVHIPPRSWLEASFLTTWTAVGALSGGVFALILAIAERKRTFAELTPRRFMLWGLLGGATIPVVSIVIVAAIANVHLAAPSGPVFALMTALGGVCASASLWLARRSRQESAGP